jgi:hypothetical protein
MTSITELMDRDLSAAEDERLWWVDLVDNFCSPECLFAESGPEVCACRCQGAHHGDIREPTRHLGDKA